MIEFITSSQGFAFFIVIFALLSIYLFFFVDKDDTSDDVVSVRKNHNKNKKIENVRKELDKTVSSKIKYTKRKKMELLFQNAGFNISYSDGLVLRFGFSFVVFILCVIIMNNVYLGLFLGGVSWFLSIRLIEILANNRISKLDKQIGPFLKTTIFRYTAYGDFEKAVAYTMKAFEGIEPLYSELLKLTSDMSVGIPIPVALNDFADRSKNTYVKLLSDYYTIASRLGTEEVRTKLVPQAYEQYEENRKMLSFFKQEIREPKNDVYIMVALFFGMILLGSFMIDGYYEAIRTMFWGQMIIAVGIAIVTGVLWFVNKKIGGPLVKYDKEKEKEK